MSLALLGSLASGLLGGMSANKAAKAQTAAAQEQLKLQEQIYEDQKERFQPWYGSGQNALAALQYELFGGDVPMMGGTTPAIESFRDTAPQRNLFGGMNRERGDRFGGGQPGRTQGAQKFRVNGQVFNTYQEALDYANRNKTGGTAYQGFKATPSYGFRRDQGLDAIEASAAARGGLYSGRTMEDLQTHGDNLAASEYDNFLARLTGQSSAGQSAAGNMATAAGQYGSNASNAWANIGNAKSAGAIGFGNQLQQGIGNALSLWQYQKQPGGMGGIEDLFASKNWLGGF